MGGTGKTPISIALLQWLVDSGLRPALLSRGYGRRQSQRCLIVSPTSDWRDSGDEPLMIAKRVPRALVIVGPSRAKAAALARSEQVDVFVLDDGFQHRQLKRDLDVVLLDVTQERPVLPPLGKFREGFEALRRADVIVLTRSHDLEKTQAMQQMITSKFPDLPILKVKFRSQHPLSLDGVPLQLEPRSKVAAYAGIAFPEKFFREIGRLGFELVDQLSLSDHGVLDKGRLKSFWQHAQRADACILLTTHKDAVKLETPMDSDILIGFLPLAALWEDESRARQVLLKQSRKPITHDQKVT